MTGIFNLRLPNQSYFCVGCRHFIKKSRKARKKQPTLSKNFNSETAAITFAWVS